MDRVTETREEAAQTEIDFSRLVHEYVASRKASEPLAARPGAEKGLVAA